MDKKGILRRLSSNSMRLSKFFARTSRACFARIPFSAPIEKGAAKVIVNSVNKSGTHLCGKLMGLLGLHDTDVHLLDTFYFDYSKTGNLDKWAPAQGMDGLINPGVIHLPCEYAMRRIQPGQYALAHIDYQSWLPNFMQRRGIKHIFMIRDPRDIIISYMEHVAKNPHRNPSREIYLYLNSLDSDSDRLMALIQGVSGIIQNIREVFDRKLLWVNDKATCVVRFEDLIGEKGGGLGETQISTIDRIRHFLGHTPSALSSKNIANELFGGKTRTFNRGVVGVWRDVFEKQHLDAFNKVSGDLLQKLGYS